MLKRLNLKKACKGRMSDLRRIKPLNAYGELSAAFAYAQTFEGRKAKASDSPDMRHAASATAADVFVTCDDQLRRLVRRAAILPGVVDLPEFIDQYVRRNVR